MPATFSNRQQIFALQVRSPEQRGSLSVTLRLERPDRFQLVAVDRVLRRRLVTLEVDGDRALSSRPRERTYCWHRADLELEGLPLGAIPVTAIAALLNGVLPIAPVAGAQATVDQRTAGGGEYADGAGRVLRYELERGWPRRFTLRDSAGSAAAADGGSDRRTPPQGTPGRPAATLLVHFERGHKVMSLRSPAEELELRWRERVVQPLAVPLPAELVPPAGFAPDCGPAAAP